MNLKEWKRALEEKRRALGSQIALSERREKLSVDLEQLKEIIADKQLQERRFQRYRPKEAARLASELKGDTRRKETLQKELKEIDHELELFGDESAEEFHGQLMTALAEHSEEAKEAVAQTLSEIAQSQDLLKSVERFQHAFGAFRHHMEEGAELTTSPRKRGVLGYLFGRNPKAVLSMHIHLAATEAKKLLRQLEELRTEPLYGAFHRFLEEFLDDAERPWNQSLYNKKFLDLYDAFSRLWQELNGERKRLEKAVAEKREAVDMLIDRFVED